MSDQQTNLFETASRMKIRFQTSKGIITPEDLWDFSFTALNTIWQSLKSQQNDTKGESLLDRKTREDTILETQIALVKYVFETKRLEAEREKILAENKREKERLLEILARKQEKALEDLSPEELLARINSLA